MEGKEGKEGGQSDVASILARRVAVEMSDSDAAHSDSEYDSDDWGDESTAWQKQKKASGTASGGATNLSQYFFKSQESLATVIDNEDEEDVGDGGGDAQGESKTGEEEEGEKKGDDEGTQV